MRHSPESDRYTDLADRRLAAVLRQEDLAELAGMSPFERLTCRVHRRWLYECIASPLHVVPVAGYRWCEDCATSATVTVDQLLHVVSVWCPQCGQTPSAFATDQIVRTCRASMAAAHQPHTGRFARPVALAVAQSA